MRVDEFVKKYNKFLVLFIICIGFILRSIGYNWGEIVTFHPDEIRPVLALMTMSKTGNYCHSNWVYPSQVTSKLLAFIFNKVLIFYNISDIQFFFIYRLFTVIISTAVIYISYRIMKKAKGERFAIAFSTLIAISPTYTKFAKEIVGDNQVLFFWLLLVLFSMKYIDSLKTRYVIAMSLCASCATMEKWNGACICLYIAAVVIIFCWRQFYKILVQGTVAIVAYIGGIILIAPNIIREFGSVIEQAWYAYDFKGGRSYPPINSYPKLFLTYFGIVTTILLIIGCYSMINSINKYSMIYMFGAICLLSQWLIMTRSYQERWGFGIFWTMYALILEGEAFLKEKYMSSKNKSWLLFRRVSVLLIVGCMITESFFYLILASSTSKDTRIKGREVLEDIGATPDNTLSGIYTVYNPGGISKSGESPFYLTDDVIALDGDEPVIYLEGIKFVVLSSLSSQDSEIYKIITENGVLVDVITSDFNNLDLFWRERGHGSWYNPDCDTIMSALRDIQKIYNGALMGPTITIYDISSFEYRDKE